MREAGRRRGLEAARCCDCCSLFRLHAAWGQSGGKEEKKKKKSVGTVTVLKRINAVTGSNEVRAQVEHLGKTDTLSEG